MTSTLSVIIPCGPMGYASLPRCLGSLDKSFCDEIIICRFEASHLRVEHEVPVQDVMVPYVPDIAGALVQAGFERAKSDWVFLLYPSEWLTSKIDCGAAGDSIAVPITVVEDSQAKIQRDILLEHRLVRRELPFSFNGKSFSPSPSAAVIVDPRVSLYSQPLPAFFYEVGDMGTAYRLAQPSGGSDGSRVERRYDVLSHTAIDARKARNALWVLFEHYSSHEELWRLGVVLDHLPYTLEDDPSIGDMKKLYQKQMGHLEKGAERWYQEGSYSPAHGIDAVYVALGANAMAHRYKWLVEECRKRGFNRILELGSTDGNNLFPLKQAAPDLSFTGVEISAEAVAWAKELSKQTGVEIDIYHADSFKRFAEWIEYGRGLDDEDDKTMARFDAVAVFEVLEHNSPAEGAALLDAAEKCVRPGGRVFITTPHGAWSLHDAACWRISERKDHINAWTVSRMRKFLEARGAADLQVERVENPQYEEANAWVFASYEVR